MKTLFINFKLVVLSLVTAMLIITTLLSSFDAKAINCNLSCFDCGSYNVNHTHNSEAGTIYLFCRDCGHDFEFDE